MAHQNAPLSIANLLAPPQQRRVRRAHSNPPLPPIGNGLHQNGDDRIPPPIDNIVPPPIGVNIDPQPPIGLNNINVVPPPNAVPPPPNAVPPPPPNAVPPPPPNDNINAPVHPFVAQPQQHQYAPQQHAQHYAQQYAQQFAQQYAQPPFVAHPHQLNNAGNAGVDMFANFLRHASGAAVQQSQSQIRTQEFAEFSGVGAAAAAMNTVDLEQFVLAWLRRLAPDIWESFKVKQASVAGRNSSSALTAANLNLVIRDMPALTFALMLCESADRILAANPNMPVAELRRMLAAVSLAPVEFAKFKLRHFDADAVQCLRTACPKMMAVANAVELKAAVSDSITSAAANRPLVPGFDLHATRAPKPEPKRPTRPRDRKQAPSAHVPNGYCRGFHSGNGCTYSDCTYSHVCPCGESHCLRNCPSKGRPSVAQEPSQPPRKKHRRNSS
mmetsp:Transcript_56620/g.94250  ORF Transcript_56620/g.94250 Transcript_56620/m.94250 type:complete len:441 (-) Transcript_56620:306-1628(-)